MADLPEALRQPPTTPWGGALQTLTEAVSFNQKILFTKYVRLVLPLDGYVFWVKAGAVSPGALLNASMMNAFAFNQSDVFESAPQFTAPGSLHYSTDMRQDEAANYASNQVVFTSQVPIENLNAIGPDVIYIGEHDGPMLGGAEPPADTTKIRFAFSSRGSYYKQADLWHYRGDAIYSTTSTQVIDDPRTLAANELIITNSLPAWLSFAQYDPPWPVPVPRPRLQVFPSFLVPDNQTPPYMAVHIDPAGTESLQAMAYWNTMTDAYTLARDRVRITLYGCNNQVALDTRDALMQWTYDTQLVGIGNMPVIRDMKEGQNELNILAQKKVIEFEVTYNQATIRNLARQLIETCIPTIYVGDVPINMNNV